MSKLRLADVLWDAANKHLGTDFGFSCIAVDAAVHEAGCKSAPYEPYDMFLRELGCETGTVMREFPQGMDRQGARYMWLLLAMHVAEDEGMTV
jgi:hypothetical protein